MSQYSIGSIAGVFIAGPIADSAGRRTGMFVGSVIIIIGAYELCNCLLRFSELNRTSGAIVVTVAKNLAYLLGGRFFLGFGVAISTTAAPAYVVEMSPPQVRYPFHFS